MPSTTRDPRSIITPDAFDVSASLVGMPLAPPWRRAMALAIDGIAIGLITAITKSFALILGIVAAVFFVRAGFKRTPVRGSVFGRAMRMSVGCLGVFIAMITAVVWIGVSDRFGGDDDGPSASIGLEQTARVVGVAVLARTFTEGLSERPSLDDATAMAELFVEEARDLDADEATIRSTLLSAAPSDAVWIDEWAGTVGSLLGDTPEPGSAPDDAERGAIADVAELTDAEVVSAYARLLAAEERGAATGGDGASADGGNPDGARRRALEARLVDLVAADSLRNARSRIAALQDELEDRDDDISDLRDELADATGGGVFGWLRERLDDLGFGFGWAALYMTVFLSWWKGQTVGKRMMGIRVVRLDGEPITWWVAFERAGGYAAGLATGLLGFAQVWWDANRQAIHDRIVGTVVIMNDAEKVIDWESAL